ncbi:amidase family protein [Anaerolineales bacterium HSG6]|nr:amidase family protein [Anaerolineales bacterium HSG6]
MTTNLAYLSAHQLHRLISTKQVSPVEVMNACLQQIDAHNETFNAICTLSEHALDEAREAESAIMRGDVVGPLHGLPVGIKEVTETANLRTTYGSPLYEDNIPTQDALRVSRLREAGAIILGKTNVPEFALGANTYNDIFGATRNPWNPALSAGGSTGGGAVGLATGMIALAEGSDLGGSLRIPASFCGIVGLRPSPGLVPTQPTDDAWDILSVNGPMARTAEDVAMMLQAMAGPTLLNPLSQPLAGRDFLGTVQTGISKGLRVAYTADVAGIGVDEAIAQICRQTTLDLNQIEVEVEEIDLDLSFAWQAFLDLRGLHVLTHHHKHLDQLDQLGQNVQNNIMSGQQVTCLSLAEANKTRSQLWYMFYRLFQRFDYVLTPCMAIPPFPVEQNYPKTIGGNAMQTYIDWIAPTFLLSLTGLPVGCVPCGLTNEKLPVGLQIIGPPRSEEHVLTLAKAVQTMRPIGWPKLSNQS